jgi:hypothetical protein
MSCSNTTGNNACSFVHLAAAKEAGTRIHVKTIVILLLHMSTRVGKMMVHAASSLPYNGSHTLCSYVAFYLSWAADAGAELHMHGCAQHAINLLSSLPP